MIMNIYVVEQRGHVSLEWIPQRLFYNGYALFKYKYVIRGGPKIILEGGGVCVWRILQKKILQDQKNHLSPYLTHNKDKMKKISPYLTHNKE